MPSQAPKLGESSWNGTSPREKATGRRGTARGRIVSLLEGGYALHALGRSVAIHIKTLSGL